MKDTITVTVGEHMIAEDDEVTLVKNYNSHIFHGAPLIQIGTADVILQTLALISDPDCDITVQMYDARYSDADNRPDEANDFYIS